MCGGVSTWTVIMRSHDFADSTNSPVDLHKLPTEFRIVKPTPSRFVVVIDVSDSMKDCVSLQVKNIILLQFWIENNCAMDAEPHRQTGRVHSSLDQKRYSHW